MTHNENFNIKTSDMSQFQNPEINISKDPKVSFYTYITNVGA